MKPMHAPMTNTTPAPTSTRLVIQRDAAERLLHLPHKAIGHILTDLLYWYCGAAPIRPLYPDILDELKADQLKSLNRWTACRENGERAKKRTRENTQEDER